MSATFERLGPPVPLPLCEGCDNEYTPEELIEGVCDDCHRDEERCQRDYWLDHDHGDEGGGSFYDYPDSDLEHPWDMNA